jgi:hypothetical protein
MNANLCTRMEWGLKRIGQDGKKARRYAGVFAVWMMSVCGLFGVLDGTPEVSYGSGTGAGSILADARAACVLSASFGLGQR